jgi:hypothetical protein
MMARETLPSVGLRRLPIDDTPFGLVLVRRLRGNGGSSQESNGDQQGNKHGFHVLIVAFSAGMSIQMGLKRRVKKVKIHP